VTIKHQQSVLVNDIKMIPMLERIFKFIGPKPFFEFNMLTRSLSKWIISKIPHYSEKIIESLSGHTEIDKISLNKTSQIVSTLGPTSTYNALHM